jgi:hypothetical protein
MPWIKLIHWNAAEAERRAGQLKALGYEVDADPPRGLDFLKSWQVNPPAAVVIDLSRLPSQGRDMGLAVRQKKSTRSIPVVFAGGDPLKVAQIQTFLPDAFYANWDEMEQAIKWAIANPPAEPVAPKSLFDAYAGQALPKKLCIRPGMKVLLLEAPQDFTRVLGELPKDVSLQAGEENRGDLIVWFVRSLDKLTDQIEAMSQRQDFRFLWISWPKKTSGIKTELTQQIVREAGLGHGLVDFKICSVDETWSGLCFTRRK